MLYCTETTQQSETLIFDGDPFVGRFTELNFVLDGP